MCITLSPGAESKIDGQGHMSMSIDPFVAARRTSDFEYQFLPGMPAKRHCAREPIGG